MGKSSNILENSELTKMTFTVPEGYFEQLSENVVMKAGRRDASTPVVKKLTPYLAMAATFLLLVAGGTFFLKHVTPEEPEVTAEYYSDNVGSEITDEDILAYLIYTAAPFEDFSDLMDE